MSPYQRGLISARSRRLRTVGVLLLTAILGLSLYGYFRLMPSFKHNSEQVKTLLDERRRDNALRPPGTPMKMPSAKEARLKKILIVQIYFVYLYWSVVAILITSVLFVAWLDLREVTANYASQRHALWQDAVDRANRRARRRGSPEDRN